jgi:bifunctional non-homologous end joining protein LigD
VILRVDGIADFKRCIPGFTITGAVLRLISSSKAVLDLRRFLCTSARRCSSALSASPEGILVNPDERGAIGSDLFPAACRMGLEGLVSKHREPPYQAGRSRHWLKVKNPKHPAMYRLMDALAAAVARAKRVWLRPYRINLRVGYQA